MSEKPQAERKDGGAAVLAVGLLVALAVLYVLSLGPAAWLVADHRISMSTYRILYLPIVCGAETSDAISRPIRWYRGLFVDETSWFWLDFRSWPRFLRKPVRLEDADFPGEQGPFMAP